MKKLLFWILHNPRTIFFAITAVLIAGILFATRTVANQWLTYTTGDIAYTGYMGWPAIILWHLFGGAVWCIPSALICLALTAYRGVPLRYENYTAVFLWSVSSSLIAGLYGVDLFTVAPGGFIGAYGAAWLRTMLGPLYARILVWFIWFSCGFVVMYDLLLIITRLLCYMAWSVYDRCLKLNPTVISEPSVREYHAEQSDKECVIDQKDDLISDILAAEAVKNVSDYQKPNLNLFVNTKDLSTQDKLQRELQKKADLLTEKLERFGVTGSVVAIRRGPVVTLYEYQPDMDTKISKIIALEDDLALALQALSIRIIAPIPGRSVVGFEVANTERQPVTMASIIHAETFTKTTAQLPLILGVDTTGDPVVADLARMPHLLIAGSTGSGKSVALNTLLISLLCSRTPEEVRLILIDPKRIEFGVYADIPHLLFPIVTDARTASLVLKWVVKHMEERYALLAQSGVRSSKEFNQRIESGLITESIMPSLLVIIDELADLMITAGRDVEESIARIAQMARAAGIHLVVATQRPSVDVITGLIKVNFPSRMAFRVASRIDSRTILDTSGADKLLGKGDMLFLDGTSAQIRRLHGAYVSDEEILGVVLQIKRAGKPEYKDLTAELATLPHEQNAQAHTDGLYPEVINYLKEIDEISISLLQRQFRIGYNRSARLIELLEQQGLIMPPDGAKPRKVVR